MVDSNGESLMKIFVGYESYAKLGFRSKTNESGRESVSLGVLLFRNRMLRVIRVSHLAIMRNAEARPFAVWSYSPNENF